MFARQTYINRRNRLVERLRGEMCRGIVLLPGNENSPNSYPSNHYYFRQDSTFRYFFDSLRPSLWGVIDIDSGDEFIFGADDSLDDLIWMGAQPTVANIAAEVGAEAKGIDQLQKYVAEALRLKRDIHILPPYRGETKIALSSLLAQPVERLDHYFSPSLIFNVAELREVKSTEEIEAMERAHMIGYEMHTRAMQMCADGVVEREIGGVLEGIARSLGAGVSFPPICTQHGETLHNIEREGVLQSGRLFLCDAGGESLEGYCSDHTRTYPVSGRFSSVQRDIYNIVLSAHDNTFRIAKPNMLYSDLQRATYETLAAGLRDLGLLRGSMAEILESNAVSLFMPHGVSHGLGLDVHDCEAMGERTFDVAKYATRARSSTSCIIRSQWRFSEGTVMSNEPGIYFIPALIESSRKRGLYRDTVDYERVMRYLDFGGIRIEDEVVITASGAQKIGDANIPVTISEIENYMSQWR